MDVITLDVAREVTEFGSHGARWTPIAASGGECHVGQMQLAAGSVLGMHPTAIDQVFFVVQGEGWTRVEGQEAVAIVAGQAAVWRAGEHHESGTEVGMTVILIQAEALTSGSSERPSDQ